MTTKNDMPQRAARIVKDELPKHWSGGIRVNDVRGEWLPGPDDEDYIHLNIILEDGHPDIDVRKVLDFDRTLHPIFERAGVQPIPVISYSNTKEIAR